MSEEKKKEIEKMVDMFVKLSPVSQEIVISNVAVLHASEEARRELEPA